jgi:uncharacterized RDD family membrane protein YckC
MNASKKKLKACNEAGAISDDEGTHPGQALCDAPTLVPATPWRRFMCIAYEGILLFGVLFFFGYGFSALAQFKGEPGVMRWIFQGFILLVLAVYFTWSWSEGRQTLPMKTMGVRVTDDTGSSLGHWRAFYRFATAVGFYLIALLLGNFAHPLFLTASLIPVAWALFDPKYRALYDVICRTRLNRSPLQ